MFALLRRLRARFKYRHFERDLAREIDVHRAMKQDELEATGTSKADARAQAVRSLGNITYMREESRSVWIARWLEQGRQDVFYALRQLRRFPAYSIGATLVLAIGVATTTVVFSAVNSVLLRLWPVEGAGRLVLIETLQMPDGQYNSTSAAEFRYLRDHATTVTDLATYQRGGAVIDAPRADVQSSAVSSSYFTALKVGAIKGRLFREEDEQPGAVPVALISYRLWQRDFQGDPNIIGHTIQVTNAPVTIVGVLESGFEDVHALRVDLWLPAARTTDDALKPVNIVARLGDTIDATRAQAELQALSRQFRIANNLPVPELLVRNTRRINAPGSSRDVRQFMLVFPALGLLMLLVCANVGGLILARTSARLRELAVRRALGASRARVSRQVFTEVLVLGLGAGFLGVLGSKLLPFAVSDRMRSDHFEPDATVFGVALLLSVIAALIAASSALFRARRISVGMLIAHRHGADRSGSTARSILVATQLAISTAVLTGAGLITRAIVHTSAADPGFLVDGVEVLRLVDPTSVIRTAEVGGPYARRVEKANRWRTEIEGLGADGIAFASDPPLSRSISVVQIRKPSDHASTRRQVSQRSISSSYFDVLGIPVIEGNSLSDLKGSDQLVVSEKAAGWLWPSEPALGKRLTVKDEADERTYTVVGVAKDVATQNLGEIEAMIYTGCGYCPVLLAKDMAPGLVAQTVAIAGQVDKSARVDHQALRQVIAKEGTSDLRDARTAAWIIGLSALALSLIGAFGVLAYTVEERRREIGIRMALGGRAWPVALGIMGAANRPAVWGIAIGALAAAGVATVLRHEVFGLTPFDPIAYVLVALVLVPPIALAAVIPARRATRVDPAITLRHD